eukprot:TRINITY_DN13607_c0_g1_i1.p1 TRINITY_DN13607_c0_g1~~TRINITY_DN13607_c0_g1_i1.p1  ORF type:complete len:438 (-),score=104.89 TRINITY_DN13607_c0_g1_i1:117-1430(-)
MCIRDRTQSTWDQRRVHGENRSFMRALVASFTSIVLWLSIFFSGGALSALAKRDPLKIAFVYEFSRHGARSPMYDTWDAKNWTLPKEELTAGGMRQHFLIGLELNHRYYVQAQLFDKNQTLTRQVSVRSTDIDRTLMSAQSQIYGFLLQKGPKFNNRDQVSAAQPPLNLSHLVQLKRTALGFHALSHDYLPIPIHTIPEGMDYVAIPEKVCPRLQQLIDSAPSTDVYKSVEARLRDNGFYEQFANLSGTPLDQISLDFLQAYWDTIECDETEARALPEWLDNSTKTTLDWVHAFLNLYRYFTTDESIRLVSSNLLADLRDSLDNLVTGKNNVTKFRHFAGHDGTLNRVMVGLGLNKYTTNLWEFEQGKGHNPPFASTLIFELVQDDEGSYYVRAIYNDQPLSLGGLCSGVDPCPYDDFKSALDSRIIKDFNEACKLA